MLKWDQSFVKNFLVQVGVHQGSVLLPLLFAIALDLITKKARKYLMNKILYADGLVLMSKSVKKLKENFLILKELFWSKELKFNLESAKVLMTGSKEEILKSKVDPCA